MLSTYTDIELRVREFGQKVPVATRAQPPLSTASWSPSSPS